MATPAPARLPASDQMALSLACEAFSEATQRFHAEPLVDAGPRPNGADATVRFTVSGKHFDMPVMIAANAGSQSVTAARLQKYFRLDDPAGPRPVMLVTSYVSASVAASLIANRIPFLDTAGNVYLEEPEVTLMITGREMPRLRLTDTTSRSTTPKGLRVSFALATQPGLVEQPYRTIADQSGVALNTVNLAVDDLIARRLVVKKNDRRMIVHRRHFIKDWVSHYATGLRTKLGARRYASGLSIDWWQGASLADFKARLGGECAAEALTHENKPVSVTLYAHGGASTPLIKAARLRPDPQGEVEILEAFWPERAEQNWNVAPGVVHPVLVFADLMLSADSRNQAVAQTLYERFLDQ
ncbi:type IV toxin-antitoxin system AbiEi family antitoxin [Paraburkholderia sp. HD33-4]|uniref:type IV toxin-antitoxin system AbiEi family antitoxin n=1 Tax=Paraburkholderia sp. HD33-4 TaxID=2883242 RepID=UPI002277C33E|nr:type IV toxin-antitoxin system AbiEi family antitoxin [Paraburkholderia sp. HD33-4]